MRSKSDPTGNVSLSIGNNVIILQTSYLELGKTGLNMLICTTSHSSYNLE